MHKKDFYEKRSERYTDFDKQSHLRYLRALSLLEIKEGARILDVGCKHAYLNDILAERGVDFDYFGIDISENVINSLKDKRGTFKVCDLMGGLPFDDKQFDLVFCLEVLEHVENPTLVLKEFHRVLKANGDLLLSVPNPYNWMAIYANIRKLTAREGHIHSFTLQDLITLLKFTGFSIVGRIGTYGLLPYTPHGIKDGNYFMFKSNSFFLTTSYIYRIKKLNVNQVD